MQPGWITQLDEAVVEVQKDDLCSQYGHENCCELEVTADADLIVCSCWCHGQLEVAA